MMMMFVAAALAAAQPAAPPAAAEDPHAGHMMHGAPDALKGPACGDCKSHGEGMNHEGIKDGGCCCCHGMHSDHDEHQPAATTGA